MSTAYKRKICKQSFPVVLAAPIGRVDPSTVSETVCGSVDGAREKGDVGRPAFGKEFDIATASAAYDHDPCPAGR